MKFHQGLTLEKWNAQSFGRQILHIASELSRARHWMKKGERLLVLQSLERALELIDLTVESKKNLRLLREFLRLREALAGFYVSPSPDYRAFLLLLRSLVDFDGESHELKLSFTD